MERMQAIKLVRTICTVSPALMPRCLVQVSPSWSLNCFYQFWN
jgi:hypothetical protein